MFSSSNFTWVRFKSSVGETVGKFVDGINFVTRGFRLLSSDLSTAGKLVYRVTLGESCDRRGLSWQCFWQTPCNA